jgi:DNA-binding MarR family transcriptional regulator
MKYVRDSAGLYDPAVREAIGRFAGDETGTFEAAAAVRAAAHAVERLQNMGERSRALSAGAVDLLLRLEGDDAGVSELARSAGFSSRNVTGLVDTLERAGLVRREQDPADRRAVLVRITEAGHAWVADFREPARRAMGALFNGFTEDETNRLRDLCLRLVANQEALSRHLATGSISD